MTQQFERTNYNISTMAREDQLESLRRIGDIFEEVQLEQGKRSKSATTILSEVAIRAHCHPMDAYYAMRFMAESADCPAE